MDITVPDAPLCSLLEIADGEAIAVDVPASDGMDSLIVLRQGDAAHVYLNICPHAGRRLDWAPGKFLLNKGTLVCAAHGASFTASSGLSIGGPCRGQSLRRVPAKVVDGQVWLTSGDT